MKKNLKKGGGRRKCPQDCCPSSPFRGLLKQPCGTHVPGVWKGGLEQEVGHPGQGFQWIPILSWRLLNTSLGLFSVLAPLLCMAPWWLPSDQWPHLVWLVGTRFLHEWISVCMRTLQSGRTSQVAETVKNLPSMWETWVRSLGWEDPLEEGMATHSRILAWRIPLDRGAWWATVHGVTKSQTRLCS